MSRIRQMGFSVVEICIAVLVVVAIGVTGYFAYSRMQEANKAPTAADQVSKGNTPNAPEINGTDDLDAAAKALNQTNVDASDSDVSELDAQASGF